MPDNSFTIGATVNVAELQEGMHAGAEVVQESLDKMLVAFSEASPAAARAVSRISEDTKVAALEVDESWQQMARASLTYSASLKEVSAATYLARKAGVDDADAMALLAAAKQKAAAASTQLAAAEAVTASETEAESISMQELAASTTEAFGTLTESFLGIGIGAAMFGHAVTEAADFNVQMHNLSLTSGISATTLAGLHDLIKEMGGDFDSVSVGLSKMLKAQQDAIQGSTKQVDGFRMLGVSVNELKSLNPEELFFRLAQGFQSVGSSAEKNAAAIDIFGRGGRALIPVFEYAGAQFRSMVDEEARVSGVTDQSIAASLQWKQETEELSVAMRGFAQDVLPGLIKAMAVVAAGAVAVGALIDTVFIHMRSTVVSAVQGVEGYGRILKDALTGNWGAIVSDAKSTKDQIADTWEEGARDTVFAWKAVGEEFHKIADGEKIPTIPKASEDLPGPKTDTDKELLTKWKEELQAKKDAEDGFHELSKADEARFWEAKLDIAKRDAKLYAEVYHEMRDAERGDQKKSLKDEEDAVRDRLAATKQGSVERVAILQEEVSHLKSIGADETEEYKRNQVELTAAVRAYADQQGKEAVEAERRKVEATRKGSEERVAAERAVLAELVSLHLEETSEYTSQLQKVTEAVRASAEERVKLEELGIDQARISGVAKVQVERQSVQAEFDLHRINAQQRIAILKQLEDEEYEIQKAAIEKKIALMAQDPTISPVQLKQAQNQLENLTREHNDKIANLNTQGAKQSQQAFDQFFQHFSTGFETAFNGFLRGTETFSRAMQGMWNSLAMSYIQSLEKMLMAAVQHNIAKLAAHTAGNQAEIASDTEAASQKQGISLLSSLKEITHSAAGAAAKAYEAMAGIPIIGPELGAVAAGATFAAVMAFQGLAGSAAGGAFLQQDMPLFAHANEMVLPAPLSLGFKDIIGRMSGGSDTRGSAPGVAASGGGSRSSGSTTNYGDVHISAFDSQGVADMIHRNQGAFTKAAARMARNGWRPR